MNKNFNSWASEFNVGSRYERKLPTPNAHYFDVDVFKKNLSQKTKTSVMKMLKRLFGISVIAFMLTSCGGYTGIRGANGCGVWYPKKYNGSAPKPRGNAHMVSF